MCQTDAVKATKLNKTVGIILATIFAPGLKLYSQKCAHLSSCENENIFTSHDNALHYQFYRQFHQFYSTETLSQFNLPLPATMDNHRL